MLQRRQREARRRFAPQWEPRDPSAKESNMKFTGVFILKIKFCFELNKQLLLSRNQILIINPERQLTMMKICMSD